MIAAVVAAASVAGALAGSEALVHSDAQAVWHEITQHAAGQEISVDVTYRILSTAGRYVSVEKEVDCDCGGAHPTSVKTLETLVPAKSGPHAVSLTAVFPPDRVLVALKADKIVAATLANSGSPQPATLPALLEALRFQSVTVGECSYTFGANLLEHFALYDRSANGVTVRIGLSADSEVCRGQMTQLGLSLPAPKNLHLDRAAAAPGHTYHFPQ